MSIKRTSIVGHNRRTINQKGIQVGGTFYISPNTNQYDVGYDNTSLIEFVIDIGDYIIVGFTNYDAANTYISFAYLKMNKKDGLIKLVFQNDADDIETGQSIKYNDGHLYVSYEYGTARYLDINFIAETYNIVTTGSYTGAGVSIDDSAKPYGGYLVSLGKKQYDIAGIRYYKLLLKFVG